MAYDRAACAEIILERLIEGTPLTTICKADDLPAASTFLGWCDEDAELAERYARASQVGHDALADKALEEARTATDAQLARLAFDAARWWLGKRAPKKYGDKIEHTGTFTLASALDAIPEA